MTQLGIFDKPRAAKRDPETSHRVGEQLEKSGALSDSRYYTLVALRIWEGWHSTPPTSRELADGNARLRTEYARRLPELREMGFVEQRPARVCRDGGRPSMTWAVTEAGRRVLNTIR